MQNLIEKLPDDGKTVDLQPLFFNFTIDNSTEFLLGCSINCQTNPAMADFSRSWDHAAACLVYRFRLGKLVGLVDGLKKDAGFEKACGTVHAFVDSYIADRLQDGNSRNGVETRRYNLLSELSSVCRDPTQLRNELLNVLLAARDTTAGLLSSIFYFLARNPDVWAALAAEVDRLEGRMPDYNTLKSMRVLRSIVDESETPRFKTLLPSPHQSNQRPVFILMCFAPLSLALRLHPPLPVNMRFAKRHTTIPRGGGADGRGPVFVAKGTAVHYSVWAMHRLPEIYGADADAFRPARWLDDARPLRPGWGYLPFNGGPRVCLGQQSALTEASYVVVRLVQHFARIEARGGEFRENLALTLSHADGVKVALWRRV